MGRVHIIGAGLAGLSAAVALTTQGREVVVYEAADQAGGRCRSYDDAKLGQRIDNGNHLLFSANKAALAYVEHIGARDSLIGPKRARFAFADLANGKCWELRPGRGRLPLWLLSARRRVPETRFGDYLRDGWRLATAKREATVGERLRRDGPLWERFWRPLVVAALNTAPEEASATLLWRVVKESFLRGEAACRPLMAGTCLASSLVEPAIAFLTEHGGQLRLNRRVRDLTFSGKRLAAIQLVDETVELSPGDTAILSVPPAVAAQLLPGLDPPEETSAIVNGHFLLSETAERSWRGITDLPILGLVGGTVDWIFLRERIASVTVSAADALAARGNDELAELLWRDVAAALGLADEPLPAHRIIKEKRATFKQSPAQLRKRRGPATDYENLFLAGDWTDTGYPATIESAVRSGLAAVRHCRSAI
jgi:squalene-associated FAD-dependent desaturase